MINYSSQTPKSIQSNIIDECSVSFSLDDIEQYKQFNNELSSCYSDDNLNISFENNIDLEPTEHLTNNINDIRATHLFIPEGIKESSSVFWEDMITRYEDKEDKHLYNKTISTNMGTFYNKQAQPTKSNEDSDKDESPNLNRKTDNDSKPISLKKKNIRIRSIEDNELEYHNTKESTTEMLA